MRVFGLSDLHLPGSDNKPMDIFGEHWDNHWEKIKDSWSHQIGEDDLILIPGDISWAMTLECAKEDLNAIGELPGHKIMLKGNHDYWWGSISRVREALPASISVMQNNSIKQGNVVIAGSRGWTVPGTTGFDENDNKLYLRESQRLQLSLEQAEKLKEEGDKLVIMMHYPPFGNTQASTLFTDIIEEAKPDVVIYGHLHGMEPGKIFEGELRGVSYKMVACDHTDFKPIQIL